VIEVTSLEEFDRRLAAGASHLDGWRVLDVDLSQRADALARVDVAGALFVGCTLPSPLATRGAVVLATVPGSPVDIERISLYTPRELYDTADYTDSLDARAYAWSRRSRDREARLTQALHDHAIDEALTAWVRPRDLVGVMGGHDLARGSEGYAEAARLGRALAEHHVVATGGGPGAMEAANLGAYLAGHPESVLDEALAMLARVPSYAAGIGAWAEAALQVVDRWPDGHESLGIPTWHYGHEPPNAFATAIAKYFRNAQREAVLLQVCDAGIVFLPGAAGTVQEIFQDACENYYADESSLAPMVLVGREHWTERLPAWPLLEALARGRSMQDSVHLVDTLEEAAAVVAG